MRIARDAAGLHQLGVVIGPVPIAGPLPDISGHVVEAVSIGRILRYGRDADETVLAGIFLRKRSLVCVGHVLAAHAELFAPNEWFSGATAARGKLPFSLGGQTLAGPPRIAFGIFVGDVHDGIIFLAFDIALGSKGMTPVRARHVTPPLKMIVE